MAVFNELGRLLHLRIHIPEPALRTPLPPMPQEFQATFGHIYDFQTFFTVRGGAGPQQTRASQQWPKPTGWQAVRPLGEHS